MPTDKELKVVDAAQGLFHRHGVRRVTMHDIAEAADMSRPALYLVFPNKEAIFETVVRVRGGETLQNVRQAVAAQPTTAQRLFAAFEVWTVGSYEIVQKSPDARDLLECQHGLGEAAMAELRAGFEAIVAQILAEAQWKCAQAPNAPRLAHMLKAASQGFKSTATSTGELRDLLKGLIGLLEPWLRT